MDGPHDQICELKIRDGWQLIGLEDAFQLHPDRKCDARSVMVA
jgi:hypothetical protein